MTRSIDSAAVPAFQTPEGLRALLIRLDEAGPGSWRFDAEAHELAKFVARKYAQLARNHGLDKWEAVTAAFDAMRDAGARRADDPWGYVTKAVKLTCYYEERGQGLLCSVSRARKKHASVHHDAERLADREQARLEYDPAFQTTTVFPSDDFEQEVPGPAQMAVESAVAIFMRLGWPVEVARYTVEYISDVLARLGSRPSAYDALRRDTTARALYDLSKKSWNTAVLVLLGNPNPAYAATRAGRGLLKRLALEEPIELVFADDVLVMKIVEAAPASGGLP
ncbi:hypothetical protein GCM10027033_00830 [Leucobacter ruminantium]|uniref:Uncharacterized protein n=2 Tax=Leucobacter ruminantium TaxID=1289170 RepID=A0A939LV82_9MICO|nr:hypothetical protein [Leucobacter ruminantium]